MPHKCAHCGEIIEKGSPQLMTGCMCGSRVFLYLRPDYKGSREETQRFLEKQSVDESNIKVIEDEFREKLDSGETVTFDIENILQVGEGRFILDLHSLLKGEPIVVKEKGVYYIDLQYAMKRK